MTSNPSGEERQENTERQIDKLSETLDRVNSLAGKQAEETLRKIMDSVMNKGVMPKTALKLGDDTMEAIYTQAYNLYNQGKYKESSYIFRLLTLLDFTTPKYVLGLAACLHRLKEYENAANLYLVCAALDMENPLPHFHAADCYLQIEAPELAIFSLSMAITAAGEQAQYAVVKERSILMKESLEKQRESKGEVSTPSETVNKNTEG